MNKLGAVAAITIGTMGYDFMEAQKYCLKPCQTNARFPTPGKRRKYSKLKSGKK
jgi:hypothetical protein